MHSYAEIWERVLEGLEATMTKTQIDLWFREMEIIALNDTDAHLAVGINNGFALIFLESVQNVVCHNCSPF